MSKRIKVFISSTIGECKSEREALRSLLRKLNHDFFLFEDEGADPNPPRHLYLKHLRESQIFVAIYKESYGYIAQDMTISGIEDEYQEACKLNTPKFIYISSKDGNRDQRLSKLIKEIADKGEVTYYKFSDTDDLIATIRTNITNHIAETYLASRTYEILQKTTPENHFNLSIRNTNFIERRNIIEEIYSKFETKSIVNLYGPAGVGKTTLLTKLASEEGYIYVPGSYLNPRDSLFKIVNDLSTQLGVDAKQYNDYDSTLDEIIELWEDNDNIALIVDDVENLPELVTIALNLNAVNRTNKIILSSRNILIGDFERVEMNFLSGSQIESIIARELSDQDKEIIEDAYQRNPEVIRNLDREVSQDLKKEIFVTEYIWNETSELGTEILIYIYLADTPLSIENLVQLVNRDNIEAHNVSQALKEIKLLLKETVLGYEIASKNIRNDLEKLIHKTPAKLSYFSKKTAKWFSDNNDYISSYRILKIIDDPQLPNILGRAALQAGIEWRQKELKYILRDQILHYERTDDRENLILVLLAYAQSEEYTGDFESARTVLDQACKINKELPPSDNFDDEIRERVLIHEAQISLDETKLQKLEELKNYYHQHDDIWSEARIGTDICVLKMHQKDYPRAKVYAEASLKIFQELGDEYGTSIAKRNLTMILQNIPGHQNEADRLLKEITKNQQPNKRQRAWLCNLMTIKFRKRGTKEGRNIAKDYALEAINIGMELEDQYIVSSNLINLANVYSDMGEYDKAIKNYKDAADIAQKIMRKDIEAAASTELAEMYNYRKEYELAKHHACMD